MSQIPNTAVVAFTRNIINEEEITPVVFPIRVNSIALGSWWFC
jgi:hypothetical protein